MDACGTRTGKGFCQPWRDWFGRGSQGIGGGAARGAFAVRAEVIGAAVTRLRRWGRGIDP